jgi:hypothetical protein
MLPYFKSEIATFYFRSTRMAIDLEQKNIYLGQKEAGITDLEGKQNFRLDATKETNKQELKNLRNK